MPSYPDHGQPDWNLSALIQALRTSREHTHKVRHRGRLRELPSRAVLKDILQGLAAAMFPTHYGETDLTDESIDHFVGNTLNRTLNLLRGQVRRGLLFLSDEDAWTSEALDARAVEITRHVADSLPEVRAVLVSDLRAAFQGDPAAHSISEILLCYPGFVAITYYRLANVLYKLGMPLLPRLMTEIAHSATGIDIHPGATIGHSFFIDHGTGVVIGETTIIGNRVRIYQNVTLGAKRFTENDDGSLRKGEPRHPIVEDDVVIYAGATVLGRVTIGRGSTIGGNVWVTQSVPSESSISQAKMCRD
ncbi:serine acetyltransferase [Verticiella sediminum]|uniref:Serine acetyltransferase n=1 Tax=Verticiella sediminum TaxID=1247510 RepID=A0A556AB61_9BURK|nr:serine O-acetyltransferase EpsC [Verticiella sediminum]TSH90113.1 serine acetyltransferase [Verticiella sediminum]